MLRRQLLLLLCHLLLQLHSLIPVLDQLLHQTLKVGGPTTARALLILSTVLQQLQPHIRVRPVLQEIANSIKGMSDLLAARRYCFLHPS